MSLLLLCFHGIGVQAAVLPASPLDVVISAPSVAPGAVAQIRLTLATPHSISAGSVAFDFDPNVFGPVIAVDAFSANGDQNGHATIANNHVVADFSSASGGLGRLPGVPVLTITLPVLLTAINGLTSSIVLEHGDTSWQDAAGNLYKPTAQPAQFKIGGAFNIDNVTPGGGMLPSGATVQIAGRGFTQASTVQIDSVVLASTAYIGPQEIEITLGGPTDLTGRRVVVQNPDGTRADFYPALRGEVVNAPPELGYPDPNARFIFPQQTYLNGAVANIEAGFALQNPNSQSVDVSIGYLTLICQPHCVEGELTDTVTLPPGAILNCNSHAGFYSGSCVGASSAVPIRMLAVQPPLSGNGPGSLSVTFAAGLPPPCEASELVLPTDPVCWLWLAGSAPATASLFAAWDEATTFTVTATTPGGQWLTLSRTSGTTCVRLISCPGGEIDLTADPSLPPGDYKASVTVTPDDPALLPVTVPFTFRVAKSVVSFLNPPHYLFFTAKPTDPPPPPVPLNVTATDNGTPFSVSLNPADTKWLLVSPSQGVTPGSIGVTVDPSAPYERTAYIVAAGPSNSVAEIVGMYIFPPTPPVLSPTTTIPASLTFWAKAGGNAPPPQTLQWYGAADTIVTDTTNQGNWLSATISLIGLFSVTVNPTGLSAGTYQGTLTFSSPSNPQSTPAKVQVRLTVWDTAPQVTATPSSLTLTAPSGTSSSVTVTVSSDGIPTDFSKTITTDDGNAWLSLGAYAPYGSATIVANAANLPPGTYYGTINMTAPLGSPTAISLPVTFVVTPALPVQPLPGPPLAISIVNAASMTAGPISPGELLTILGLNIGPNVSTNLPGLQVLFDGVPATLLYASPTQVNLVAPFEIAGKTSVSFAVEFNGERYSTAMTAAPTAPGIFTADGTGVGELSGVRGAVSQGSIIHLLATGLGQTMPAEVTGEIVSDGTPKPIAPISVTVGGISAKVLSVVAEQNNIAGLFTLDILVPAGITPGPAVPVVLTAGPVHSPNSATIGVR